MGKHETERPIGVLPRNTSISTKIEGVYNRPAGDVLRDLYWEQGLSINETARKLSDEGVQTSYRTVFDLMKKTAVPTRSHEEALRIFWGNPENRKRVHSPDANRKRSEAASAYHARLREQKSRGRINADSKKIIDKARQAGYFSQLSEREKYVLEARYPIDGASRTLAQIAKEIGFSRQRIHQVEREALESLREM